MWSSGIVNSSNLIASSFCSISSCKNKDFFISMPSSTVRGRSVFIPFYSPICYFDRSFIKSRHLRPTTGMVNETSLIKFSKIKSMLNENVEELSDDEEDEICPVECVREFKTDEELLGTIEKAKESNALVVVDFYRTACGSCKYVEQGFIKLCKGSGKKDAPVIFLKHNVIDEYDDQSEVAERLRIKSVPLFHFYKNGVLLEAFPTRDKERILAAILKYTDSSSSLQVDSIS